MHTETDSKLFLIHDTEVFLSATYEIANYFHYSLEQINSKTQKFITKIIFMEILSNFCRKHFVPGHQFKTDGLINLSAMYKT